MTPDTLLLAAVVTAFLAAILRSLLLHAIDCGSPAVAPVRRIAIGMAIFSIACAGTAFGLALADCGQVVCP